MLERKTGDLERFHKVTVDREHEMIILKSEINDLLEKLGQPKKFQSLKEFKKKYKQ